MRWSCVSQQNGEFHKERGDARWQSAVQPVTTDGNLPCSLPYVAGFSHDQPVKFGPVELRSKIGQGSTGQLIGTVSGEAV